MPSRILTARPLHDEIQRSRLDLDQLVAACADTKFNEIFARDKKGKVARGEWQKALLDTGTAAPIGDWPPIEKQNVNDFLKYVPRVVVPKGTELFHVSKSKEWVKKSMVGGNKADDFSFFTLREKGFADKHANEFAARIQMRIKVDVHAFFCPEYSFKTFSWDDYRHDSGKTQKAVHEGKINVGGELVGTILTAWPAQFRPVAICGRKESELIFWNGVIPRVMDTTGIATSTDNFATRTIVHFGELPASSGGKQPGLLFPPAWMGPTRANNDALVERAALAMKSRFNAAHAALFS